MSGRWGEYVPSEQTSYNAGCGLLSPSDFLLSSYEPFKTEKTSSGLPFLKTENETKAHNVKSEELSLSGGIVAHNIKLNQLKLNLHSLLATTVQEINEGTEHNVPSGGHLMFEEQLHACDKMLDQSAIEAPDISAIECHNCHKKQKSVEQDVDDIEFVRGLGSAPEHIAPDQAVNLLRKSTAQICRHQGFNQAEPLALNALAAAAQTFYTKLLTQLRHNIDMEAMHGHTGFQDAVHRTLTQIGQSDISSLLEDYHCSIVQRHDKLIEHCTALAEMYKYMRSSAEIPDQCAELMPSIYRESSLSVFSLTEEMDDKSDVASSSITQDNQIDEDDAQKLLELAGLSGFDITLEAEQDEQITPAASSVATPSSAPISGNVAVASKGKGKSYGKVTGPAAKRKKKN